MEASQVISQRDQLDCHVLHSFLSCNGASNCESLKELLTKRSTEDLNRVVEAYRATYNQDILHQLCNIQRRNNFLSLVHLQMMEPRERDAKLLRDALHGPALGSDILIEVFCTRSSSQLQCIKQAYRSQYNRNIEQDISLKAHSTLKEVLTALSSINGAEGSTVDVSMGMCDAKILYEAIESGASTDQRTILSVLTRRNIEQLRTILHCYEQLYGHHISKFLKQKRHGEFGRTLSSVTRCISYPEKHYAKQLKDMWVKRRLATEPATDLMIRVVVAKSGVNIGEIRSAFSKKSGGTALETAVRTLMSDPDYHTRMVAEVFLKIVKCS
ncbi:annexin Gh1-like [Nymphaea colorata]|nr:annexin Gh1-like [Nymphaea colorata]